MDLQRSSIVKLDSHQHLWKYHPQDYPWIKDEWTNLKQDFLPQDSQIEMNKINFDGCVVVQVTHTLKETQWYLLKTSLFASFLNNYRFRLLDLTLSNPFIKGIVGWVDLTSSNVETDLQTLLQHPNANKLVGIRHIVQDEPDDKFLLGTAFQNGISILEKFNLTYDILIFPKHLKATHKFVQQHQNMRFVIDHLVIHTNFFQIIDFFFFQKAKPCIKDGSISPWKEDIIALSKFPNVFCKVSGMVTEAKWNDWKLTDFEPYLDVVYLAFGSSRLMIGSDWPVCLLSSQNYVSTMNVTLEWMKKRNLSQTEQEQILGKTCKQFYQL